MKNRIINLFNRKGGDVLNVYFTAGHPELNDTTSIITALDHQGVDLVEIGMPYSDPMADGETIQNSSQRALKNGMTLSLLMEQITTLRQSSNIPIIIMGYYNQMMQYGEERFLQEASEAGVDGLIIPDLPMDVYAKQYKNLFEKYNVTMSFLITPETSDDRIRMADELSNGFLYVVSKSSITGSSSTISDRQKAYFNHINSLDLNTPRLIGFGIHDKTTYDTACEYAQGAIIGSAFIRALEANGKLEEKIGQFIGGVRS